MPGEADLLECFQVLAQGREHAVRDTVRAAWDIVMAVAGENQELRWLGYREMKRQLSIFEIDNSKGPAN